MFRDPRPPQRFKAFTNWGRNFSCSPSWTWSPASLEEIVGALAFAAASGLTVRPVGAGYSYTRLVHTDQMLLSLESFAGIESIDAERGLAVVRGGTRLRDLLRDLDRRGFALETSGDVDVQSLAGALGTGTHGTGISFGSLSSLVEAMTLVTATGEVVELRAGEDDERLDAARLSLGSLGIVARVTLRVVPASRLLVEKQTTKLATVLASLDAEVRSNRHFEFFWVPNSDLVYSKRINVAEGARGGGPSLTRFVNEVLVENATLWAASRLVGLRPSIRDAVVNLGGSFLQNEASVRRSHEAYPTDRLVKHQEIEYAVPYARVESALAALESALRRLRVRTVFPIEVRFVAAERAYLSPSFDRDVAYIAAHTYLEEDHQDYFDAVEQILRAHEGRPHWGKLHSLRAAEIAPLYPQWDAFLRVRAALDPGGRFVNPYLAQTLGLTA